MKKKLVLVTGAGGFIGSNLTEELLRRGYRVRALLKDAESTKNISALIDNKNIEIIRGNLLSKETLRKAVSGVEVVFHLAAKADLSAKSYRPYFLNNVIGTKNITEACRGKVKKFVHFSSILAVGLPNIKTRLDENYEGKPQHFYGVSKKETEKFLMREYKDDNFPVVILRPSTVYGPREFAVQYLLFRVIKEGKFVMVGSGNNLTSYVYVKNVVDATLKVANSSKTSGQIYFINDERPYKFKEVVEAIYRAVGKKPYPIKIPFWLAYAGSFIYAKICKLLGMKPLIYPSRVKTMILDYAYSIKKAKRDFGYKPRYDLNDGVKETYKWYLDNGYI